VEKVLAHHADDFVLFDVPPPALSLGIDAYRRSWRDTFLPWFGDAGTFEVSRLEITAGKEVAYCRGLTRCSGTDANGQSTEELVVRLTVGLVKIDGAWTVVHEHHSQPSS
jgi:ketosteroid isomerase-like protein